MATTVTISTALLWRYEAALIFISLSTYELLRSFPYLVALLAPGPGAQGSGSKKGFLYVLLLAFLMIFSNHVIQILNHAFVSIGDPTWVNYATASTVLSLGFPLLSVLRLRRLQMVILNTQNPVRRFIVPLGMFLCFCQGCFVLGVFIAGRLNPLLLFNLLLNSLYSASFAMVDIINILTDIGFVLILSDSVKSLRSQLSSRGNSRLATNASTNSSNRSEKSGLKYFMEVQIWEYVVDLAPILIQTVNFLGKKTLLYVKIRYFDLYRNFHRCHLRRH